MARPRTKSAFARLAGVTEAAIRKQCREGGKLFHATTEDGKVDLDHHAARDYLKGKGKRPPPRGLNELPAAPVEPPEEDGPWPPEDGPGSSEDLDNLADLLHPIMKRFGTRAEFADWVDVLKKVEETIERRIKNAKARGELVDREKVRAHVFGHLDRLHRNLLRDASATIVQRLYPMAGAGEPVEEAQKVVRDIIGSHLKPAKTSASRGLTGA